MGSMMSPDREHLPILILFGSFPNVCICMYVCMYKYVCMNVCMEPLNSPRVFSRSSINTRASYLMRPANSP